MSLFASFIEKLLSHVSEIFLLEEKSFAICDNFSFVNSFSDTKDFES